MTLVEQKPTVLRDWDPLVGQKISESLREAGVTMKTGYTFEPEMLPADCDMVLVATGRQGNTKDLNLSQIGVQEGRFIQTTPELRIRGSEFSNIYVIGDANGLLLFEGGQQQPRSRAGALRCQGSYVACSPSSDGSSNSSPTNQLDP